MLAYSQRFWSAVQSETNATNTIAQAYADFLAAYRTLPFPGVSKLNLPMPVDGLLAAGAMHDSWASFIAAMFDAYDNGLSARIAGTPANPALRDSALSFSFSLPPDSYPSPDENQLFKKAVHISLDGTSARSRAATGLVGPIPASYAVTSRGVLVHVPLATDKPGSAAVWQTRSWWRAVVEEPLSTALPAAPGSSVATIAAGSSAAAGFLGSPSVMESVLSFTTKECMHDLRLTMALWPRQGAQKYGVCTSGSTGPCKFPSTRMLDGSYTDNLGIIHTLASLQTTSPNAESLRLVASFSNSCTGNLTMANCNHWDNSLERLFANPTVAPSNSAYPSAPGAPYTSTAISPTQAGAIVYSQQVFAEACPEWQQHGPSVYRTLTLNLTTVENPVFGVKGGTRVTLLVLYGNVGPSCGTITVPAASPEYVAACSSLASGMREFVVGMGQSPTIQTFETGDIITPHP